MTGPPDRAAGEPSVPRARAARAAHASPGGAGSPADPVPGPAGQTSPPPKAPAPLAGGTPPPDTGRPCRDPAPARGQTPAGAAQRDVSAALAGQTARDAIRAALNARAAAKRRARFTRAARQPGPGMIRKSADRGDGKT